VLKKRTVCGLTMMKAERHSTTPKKAKPTATDPRDGGRAALPFAFAVTRSLDGGAR